MPDEEFLRAGEVAWYATGRFYVSEDRAIVDAGYFIHLQGVEGPLFAHHEKTESTAHFTFASEPFRSKTFQNASVELGLDTVGTFSIHLQREPHGTFDDPSSFALGECVATFQRVSVVVGTTVGSAVTVNTFTAKLVWSCEFEFQGRRYDFARLLPHGITQWGTASPDPVTPAPEGYQTVLAFAGSAIASG